MVFLHALPKMSRDEFQKYWWLNHGPLDREYCGPLHLHRYIQVHTIDDPLEEKLRSIRGKMEDSYAGVGECWQDQGEFPMLNVAEMARFFELLKADELRFIDLPRCTMMTAKEYVFLNKPLSE